MLRNYKELKVWQKSYKLCLETCRYPRVYTRGTNICSVALRPFLNDCWEAAVLFTTYQRGKPQPTTCRGNAESRPKAGRG